MAVRAIFLDKDGTLVDNVPDNVAPQPIRLSQGALAAWKVFARLKFRLFVVTNQSAIARGGFGAAALEIAFDHIRQLLNPVYVDGIYVCPHADDAHCRCRKPKPGMLREIEARFNVDLDNVPAIGDSLRDIQAAVAVGARPLLVLTGKGRKTLADADFPIHTPTFADLAAAVAHIVKTQSA